MNPCYLFLFLIFTCPSSLSQEIQAVVFYNVENLFDSKDNPNTYDEDFTPNGRYHWTIEMVSQKINQIAKTLAEVGKRETQQAPLLIGLAEIENRAVVEQLIKHPKLRPFNYGIVHFESPDFRGIDVCLLYRKDHFILEHAKVYALPLVDPKTQHKRTTRDQLVVSGYWKKYVLSILVNHWPSRRGGQKRSEASRMAAAALQLKIIDSLQRLDPKRYLISMGDFNDNPTNRSVKKLTTENSYRPFFKPLYNPMTSLFKKGVGTLAHRDRWHLFDQILFDQELRSGEELLLLKTAVFNPSYLRNPRGKFKGYPYRHEIQGVLLKGYSDHFPVYVLLGIKNE